MKQNFLEPLTQLQTKDIKEVNVSSWLKYCRTQVGKVGGGGGGGVNGQQFRSQMYFYYTNRGTHIYIWPWATIPPALPLGNFEEKKRITMQVEI